MPKRKKNKNSASNKSSTSNQNWRINTLFIIFTLVSLGLLVRLYNLQIVNGPYYSALARGQGIDFEDMPQRGEIYFQDNAGETRYIAATNKELFLSYADPKEIIDENMVLEKISEIAVISEEEKEKVSDRLKNKDSSYALIVRNLTKEQSGKIEELSLPGVYSRTEVARYYPAGIVGAHVLGFLGFSGSERIGQYGVEERYNNLLSGQEADDSVLGNLFSSNIANSADIELTIDYGVQFVIEKKLEEMVNRFSAENGTAIFMDPATGAIIAMANYPDYDPNVYSEVEDINILHNNAVQSVYELGSIFKPITMAAAIDAGAIAPQTEYTDTGSIVIGSYTISNVTGSHGASTMTQVIEKSLNTGVVFAQQALGKKPFREYMEAFQLDKKTGIDLPGEVLGNMENIKNTNRDINFATASFGQGISFSPLRFLSSLSAIANGGVIMKPYIVEKIITDRGEIVTKPQVVAQPISALTASRVTAMMVSAVENGYSTKVKVPGYTFAGKTGTAQIPNIDSVGYSDRTLHSFVGFAPAYAPKFIGIVTMNNPKGIRFASDSIAPVFRDMASFILQYYNVPPQ